MKEIEGLEIISPITKGGQKSVFLAKYNNNLVVYKVGKCNYMTSLKRIIREVNILRGINSQYFPQNYYFDYDSEGNFQIIEQYIKGETLENKINEYNSEVEILKLLIELINGMQILWDKEIIHRDLKPGNIIISKNCNKPVIIDLGIARDLLDESLTKTIMASGPCTEQYAAPEQLKNQKNNISARTDFFSMGIIGLELYYKMNPFSPMWVGSGLSIRDNILCNNVKLVRKSEKSKEFIEVIKKMIEPEPFNRYRTYNIMKKAMIDIIKE